MTQTTKTKTAKFIKDIIKKIPDNPDDFRFWDYNYEYKEITSERFAVPNPGNFPIPISVFERIHEVTKKASANDWEVHEEAHKPPPIRTETWTRTRWNLCTQYDVKEIYDADATKLEVLYQKFKRDNKEDK